jgi:hypothetical protein
MENIITNLLLPASRKCINLRSENGCLHVSYNTGAWCSTLVSACTNIERNFNVFFVLRIAIGIRFEKPYLKDYFFPPLLFLILFSLSMFASNVLFLCSSHPFEAVVVVTLWQSVYASSALECSPIAWNVVPRLSKRSG